MAWAVSNLQESKMQQLQLLLKEMAKMGIIVKQMAAVLVFPLSLPPLSLPPSLVRQVLVSLIIMLIMSWVMVAAVRYQVG